VKYAVDYELDNADPAYDGNDDCYLYSANNSVSVLGSLFAELRDRSGLAPEDLLRIGTIYVDLIYIGKYASKSLTNPNDTTPRVAVTQITWDPNNRYSDPRYRDAYLARFTGDGPHGFAFEDLLPEEKAHCQRINIELGNIERHYFSTGRAIAERLNARIATPGDLLWDYEIEFFVDYRLSPDDPLADQSDSMILLRRPGDKITKNPQEWREAQALMDHDYCESFWCDETGIRHCYLYHDLYDHAFLDWKDLPRIDRIEAELEVWLQRAIEL
jgi:hypothetical protein